MPRAITAFSNVFVIPNARRNPYDYVGCTPPTRHHYGVHNHTRINTCHRRWNFLVIDRKAGRRRAPMTWGACRECLASSETPSSSFIQYTLSKDISIVPLQILISTPYTTIIKNETAAKATFVYDRQEIRSSSCSDGLAAGPIVFGHVRNALIIPYPWRNWWNPSVVTLEIFINTV